MNSAASLAPRVLLPGEDPTPGELAASVAAALADTADALNFDLSTLLSIGCPPAAEAVARELQAAMARCRQLAGLLELTTG